MLLAEPEGCKGMVRHDETMRNARSYLELKSTAQLSTQTNIETITHDFLTKQHYENDY